jgi:tRNA pseudouridine55 synthase
LFGVATDSYDCVGKVLGRAPYSHITKECVEKALQQFRGKILQKPPIFSALRVQGKRLYEYAREGKKAPVEIQERPVEVMELELVEWLEGGTHPFTWPEEEASQDEKTVAEQVLYAGKPVPESAELGAKYHDVDGTVAGVGMKRKWEFIAGANHEDNVLGVTDSKRRRSSISGAPGSLKSPEMHPADVTENTPPFNRKTCPPAARIRMTVTSGFYVRSLCHDLGQAVGSMGIMSELVRTRQGQFSLKENVLEYDDLIKGEDEWGPKVHEMLSNWAKETK